MQTRHTQAAFCLHQYRYGESGAIVELLTQELGYLRLVAHGVYKEKSRLKPLLQAFVPLLVSWQSRGRELERLQGLEEQGVPLLQDQACYPSGLYLNQLIRHLFKAGESEQAPAVFAAYHASLQALGQGLAQAPILRQFELGLLHSLGYQPPFEVLNAGVPCIEPSHYYDFRADVGVLSEHSGLPGVVRVRGEALLSLQQSAPSSAGALVREERDLMRHVVSFHTGGKSLMARSLYRKPRDQPLEDQR